MRIDGQCHCGHVTYEAEIDPDIVSICHCGNCQRMTGSAYRVTALARAYLVSEWANRVLGISESTAYGELALELYERIGDLDGAAKASNNLGAIAYFDGGWDDALRFATATAALKHTIPGDFCLVTRSEVDQLLSGGISRASH